MSYAYVQQSTSISAMTMDYNDRGNIFNSYHQLSSKNRIRLCVGIYCTSAS